MISFDYIRTKQNSNNKGEFLSPVNLHVMAVVIIIIIKTIKWNDTTVDDDETANRCKMAAKAIERICCLAMTAIC